MTLWSLKVEPLVRAAVGRDAALRRITAVCVDHAVRQVVVGCSTRLPAGHVAVLLDVLGILMRHAEQPNNLTLSWPELDQLEAILPDPDSELHCITGWGCAVEAVLDLAHTLRHRYVVDAVCNTLDIAYQAATREAIQAVMTCAVDEMEYLNIENSLAECLAEIDYQVQLLRSL